MTETPLRITLLGCGGFIGSHLTEWLLDHSDAEVTGTDIAEEKIGHLLGHPRFTYHHSDLRRDTALTARLIEESDVVVDLVAVASPKLYVQNPLEVFELDFMENLRVVEACANAGTRLVQFSTCEVYGRTWLSAVPDGLIDKDAVAAEDVAMSEDETPLIVGTTDRPRWIYSASKQMLDRVIHAYGMQRGMDYAIIRPFNFVGPRFDYLPSERGGDDSPRVFAHFMNALLYGTDMRLVDGGQALRAYTYIDDAVECIGRIVVDRSGATSRQVFNVGSPANEISVEGLAWLMRDLYVERHWDGETPLPRIVSVSHEEFYGAGYEDCDRRIPDIGKARRLLGWEPKWTLHDLVAETMDWFVEDWRARHPEAPSGESTSARRPLATV